MTIASAVSKTFYNTLLQKESAMTGEKQIVEVNVCGQICPSSLLTALREVNRFKAGLKTGELSLVFLTDNPDSTNRIREAVGNMGYLVEVQDLPGCFRIAIDKAVN